MPSCKVGSTCSGSRAVLLDDIFLVSEEDIVATMRLLWERCKLVVEPSGAVPVGSLPLPLLLPLLPFLLLLPLLLPLLPPLAPSPILSQGKTFFHQPATYLFVPPIFPDKGPLTLAGCGLADGGSRVTSAGVRCAARVRRAQRWQPGPRRHSMGPGPRPLTCVDGCGCRW